MTDLGTLSGERDGQPVQKPVQTHAQGGQPQKLPGQVQTITLPGSQQAAHGQIQQLLRSELGPWDLVVPVGTDSVFITYDQDDANAAKEASNRIVQKIDTVLDGSCQSQLIDVRGRDGALRQTVLKKFGKALAADKVSWEPLERPTVEKPGKKQETATQESAAEPTPLPATYEIGYAPMWNIRNEVLMGFAVLPVTRTDEGADKYGRTVLGEAATASDLHALDIRMLQTQINTAAELLPKKFTSLLVSQIHFDTLSSSAGRNEVLQIAQQIPPHMKGFLLKLGKSLPRPNLQKC
jgi:hypothetical protein